MEANPKRDPVTCILSELVPTSVEDEQGNFEPKAIKERRWQWARPQVEGEGPCARGGHTATLVGPTDPTKASARIFIFGGHYDKGDNKGFEYLNDTFILDIDENTWYQPRCRGTPPEARYGHSAALVGTRIVYFGGKGKNAVLRDLHALDASTLTWFQGPSSGGTPSARFGHTATLHGTRLYVFGGACGTKYYGDLYCLDLASMAWSCPNTSGPKPTPRYGHTTLLVGESLIIHGGFCLDSLEIGMKDKSGDLMKSCYLNDIRVLDLTRMQYSRLRTHGVPPVGRFGHTMVLSEDDAIMFGGYSGSAKDPNQGVLFFLRDKIKEEDPKEEEAKEEETNDYCITLRTADMNWVRNKYTGVTASRRYGHSATAIGPHLIIFGGWDGGKPLSDVVVLRDQSVAEKGSFMENADVDENQDGIPDDEEDFGLETGEN
mmetsp:Transcript_71270/g.149006  ORF Transcript_71270/g.149006 Transcript_71270/m.149006 type:complete len:432 (+) Transcript_71270:127-1422(+)